MNIEFWGPLLLFCIVFAFCMEMAGRPDEPKQLMSIDEELDCQAREIAVRFLMGFDQDNKALKGLIEATLAPDMMRWAFEKANGFAWSSDGAKPSIRERWVRDWYEFRRGLEQASDSDRADDMVMQSGFWAGRGKELADSGDSAGAEKCFEKGKYYLECSNRLRSQQLEA